jgi:dienelactone hydrolase
LKKGIVGPRKSYCKRLRESNSAMNRSAFLRALGKPPEKTPLQAATLESVDCGSYLRHKVEYATEPGERTRAFLCIPKNAASGTAAIFCHHQHDWNFALGKSEVVGLAGDPNQAYAAELAQRGLITLAPDAIGFEERNWSGGTFETSYYELATRLVQGRTSLAKVLHDVSVGMDYLETVREVDSRRIGFIGHSYGGRMAIWASAFDRRIRASVSNCGCVNYKNSLRRGAGIQMEFCVPGIMSLGDIEDVVALVAPTPLYISAGEDDKWSRGAQAIFDAAKPSFPNEYLKLKIWPCGHLFTDAMRAEAYGFLEKHLKT